MLVQGFSATCLGAPTLHGTESCGTPRPKHPMEPHGLHRRPSVAPRLDEDRAFQRAAVHLGHLEKVVPEAGCYATWFNDHRPHQALDGRTPTEVYRGSEREARVIEPRPKWPVEKQAKRTRRIERAITLFESRRHLPIIELTPAA